VIRRLLLIVALALASCGPRQTHEAGAVYKLETNVNAIAVRGKTPRGIRWFSVVPIEASRVAAEIDREATDELYDVVIMPGPFATPYSVTGVALGLTSVSEMRIYVALCSGCTTLLPALRHEYHHVYLYKRTGSADPQHADLSWATKF